MKSSMPGLFLLLLLLSSTVSGLGSVLDKTIVYIQKYYTWEKAQNFCRSAYSDLAVLYKQSDVDNMDLDQYLAWVRVAPDDNIWDVTLNWDTGDQQNNKCPYVNYEEQRLHAADCDKHRFFICSTSHGKLFVNKSRTWLEAEDYCQNFYNHLVVIKHNSDLNSAVKRQDFPVWTGLQRNGETWRWSAGMSDYRNWAPDEPGSDGDCVAISSVSKRMTTQSCSDRYPFVCFRDNLILVKENRTWEEALEHCKALGSQLVSVQPGDDYAYMMDRAMEADTDEVWTGLRHLAGSWLWVNGADVTLSDLPRCPLTELHCGALSKNQPESLEARDCLEEKNFLCYS